VWCCCQDEDSEIWYHEGPAGLLASRYWIADYSIPRARDRLAQAQQEASKPGPEKAARTQDLNKKIRVREDGQVKYMCKDE